MVSSNTGGLDILDVPLITRVELQEETAAGS